MKIKVKIDNQTFEVAVGDLNARPVIATVDGQAFEVYPEDLPRVASPAMAAPVAVAPVAVPAAAPAAAATAPTSGGAKGGTDIVKAPIPGVIVTIAVKDGDPVKKGQEVCVLEAMKMKNSIKAQRDGKVVSVKVKVGDHVTNGQTLVELGD
jgi:biotin carboxyl carrier protein